MPRDETPGQTLLGTSFDRYPIGTLLDGAGDVEGQFVKRLRDNGLARLPQDLVAAHGAKLQVQRHGSQRRLGGQVWLQPQAPLLTGAKNQALPGRDHAELVTRAAVSQQEAARIVQRRAELSAHDLVQGRFDQLGLRRLLGAKFDPQRGLPLGADRDVATVEATFFQRRNDYFVGFDTQGRRFVGLDSQWL